LLLDLLETGWEDLWEGSKGPEAFGAVYTRPDVVDLILDLAGYSPDSGRRLAVLRVLEPGCGDGAFISAVVGRLLCSELRHHGGSVAWDDPALDGALRAVDINAAAVAAVRASVGEQLVAAGCPARRAAELAARWTVHADFLLNSWTERFDLICGNPPYLRLEDVPKAALAHYRANYSTLTDRADLFVAFIERGLHLLSPHGCLAFICANRFAKNQYGAAIRRMIARDYHVRFYLNLEHTQPFEREVSAYPAVIVVDREQGGPTAAGTLADLEPATLRAVRGEAIHSAAPGPLLSRFDEWYPSGAPWLTTCHDEQSEHERLFAHLPTLERSAQGTTKIGIGVATGADRVFIVPGNPGGVEADRLLPLAVASDVSNQGVAWSGSYLLNPFAPADDGSLVELAKYPGFARYLDEHASALRARHVARARPQNWFRTIDRVWPALQRRPKLLIPDIQAHATIGYDPGELYPHHNLYWITSSGWNLQALKALLRSDLVYRQVKAHSVQMRGGSVRWQAQTLRRVRVPDFRWLRPSLVAELVRISTSDDQPALDALAAEAFAARG
jgi:methylase of polypeptide subunit release factors